MASNYTEHYDLCQWEATDQVQRTDFNADNAKVDAALKALSDQVVQKANQSAVNTVISAVNQKADAATVSSLTSLLNSEIAQRQEGDGALQSALALKGNCQIYYTSYVGDGTWGEDNPCVMTFPHKPIRVAITEESGSNAIALRGADTAYRRATGASSFSIAWGEHSFSWWHRSGEESQMNKSGETYYFMALLDIQEE